MTPSEVGLPEKDQQAYKVLQALVGQQDADLPSLDIVYGHVHDELVRQLDDIDKLDTKAAAVVALAGALIVGWVVTAFDLLPSLVSTGIVARALFAMMIAFGMLGSSISLIAAIAALWTRTYRSHFEPLTAPAAYLAYSAEYTKAQLLINWAVFFALNKSPVGNKVDLLKLSLGAVCVDVLWMAAVALICLLVI